MILVMLLLCIGISVASLKAARKQQSHPEELANIPTYNKAAIDKFRTMFRCATYILFYAILCYGFKCVRQKMPVIYELFNALAGFFVFLVFVCWERARKIWQQQGGVNASDIHEMIPMTNGSV
jgi:hypothetical protein